MATLSTAARNAVVEAVVSLLETGSTFTRPVLIMYPAGGSPNLTSAIGMDFGDAADGAAQATFPFGGSIVNDGTLELGRVLNRAAAITLTVSVGTGSEEIQMTGVNAAVGQVVTMSQLTLTMPAS